jgi:hypothetical protein
MAQTLAQFFTSYPAEAFKSANGWAVDREGDLVQLHLVARDQERYTVLFDCYGYALEAPGAAFINREGSKNDLTAWPKGNSRFYDWVKHPPNSFVCMPLTREGLSRHEDWRNNSSLRWDGEKHTLLDLFNFFHRLLQSPDYEGRAGT